jgi:hypothetical protein
MAWLTEYDPRNTPGALTAGYQIRGGELPAALFQRRRNELLEQVAPALREFFRQKQTNDVANYLQNMMEPPRAEAVNQGAYDPTLAAQQGLYSATAPGATRPFTGGAQMFQARQMYHDIQQQEEDRGLKNELTRAHITHLTTPSGSNRVPVVVDGQTYYVTPDQALRHRDASAKENDIISKSGLSVEDLDTPDLVKHYRVTGKGNDQKQDVISAEDAKKDPSNVFANPPGSKDMIPLSQWDAAAAAFKRKHGAQTGGPAASQFQQYQQALEWAKAHPDDPRSDAILKKLGLR